MSESLANIVPTLTTGNITVCGFSVSKRVLLVVLALVLVAVGYWVYRRRTQKSAPVRVPTQGHDEE